MRSRYRTEQEKHSNQLYEWRIGCEYERVACRLTRISFSQKKNFPCLFSPIEIAFCFFLFVHMITARSLSQFLTRLLGVIFVIKRFVNGHNYLILLFNYSISISDSKHMFIFSCFFCLTEICDTKNIFIFTFIFFVWRCWRTRDSIEQIKCANSFENCTVEIIKVFTDFFFVN